MCSNICMQDIGRQYESVCVQISWIQGICFNTYSGLIQWDGCWDQYCAQTSVHDMCHVSVSDMNIDIDIALYCIV